MIAVDHCPGCERQNPGASRFVVEAWWLAQPRDLSNRRGEHGAFDHGEASPNKVVDDLAGDASDHDLVGQELRNPRAPHTAWSSLTAKQAEQIATPCGCRESAATTPATSASAVTPVIAAAVVVSQCGCRPGERAQWRQGHQQEYRDQGGHGRENWGRESWGRESWLHDLSPVLTRLVTKRAA